MELPSQTGLLVVKLGVTGGLTTFTVAEATAEVHPLSAMYRV